jgi:DNA polymerase-4/protein ImuB
MRLACITVPHFRIALERARRPQLRTAPLAIGEPPPGANEVLDCSAEATALGVRPGMPLRDARTIVPDLIVLPSDPVHYDQAFEALLSAVESIEPAVEAGEDVAYAALDPHATDDAHREAVAMLLNVVREQTGVAACGGIGEGKFIAQCAAWSVGPGDIALIPRGEEAQHIATLPVSALPVSYEARRKLTLYGLRTIGEVARPEIGPAQAQFGAEGRRLWELARGIDTTRFVPRERTEPVRASLTMPAPTVHTAALLIAARQLTGRLLRAPVMRYRQVRAMRLRLALSSGGSWERTLTFREPLGDEDGVVFVLKKLLEPIQLPAPVEEMALEFIGLTSETGKQRSLLFAEQARRRAQLFVALQQLRTQFGGAQVARVVEVEPWSRIPERRYALIDYDL